MTQVGTRHYPQTINDAGGRGSNDVQNQTQSGSSTYSLVNLVATIIRRPLLSVERVGARWTKPPSNKAKKPNTRSRKPSKPNPASNKANKPNLPASPASPAAQHSMKIYKNLPASPSVERVRLHGSSLLATKPRSKAFPPASLASPASPASLASLASPASPAIHRNHEINDNR